MFAKWKIYFKSKMKDEEWGLTNILLWTAVLNEFDVTEQELIEGTTKACFARELNGWPPTTVTDFINIFRTETASEYPTAQAAFDNACNQCGLIEDRYVKRKWLHSVVLETANRIGAWKLKTADSYFLKTFTGVYEQVVAEHKQGASFEVAEDKRLEVGKHQPVQAGSEADKQITAKLEALRRVSA